MDTKAPPAFWARIVSTDEIRLNPINGSLSASAERNVSIDWIRLNGYQSKINRTAGRLTAIGLLNKARIKKPKEKRYGLCENAESEAC